MLFAITVKYSEPKALSASYERLRALVYLFTNELLFRKNIYFIGAL